MIYKFIYLQIFIYKFDKKINNNLLLIIFILK